MVEQRANLDYGRDDDPSNELVMIDDDGVLVTDLPRHEADDIDDGRQPSTADPDYQEVEP